MSAKRTLYLCMPGSAFTAENRAQNKDSMSGGHTIMSAKRTLYLCMPGSAFTAESREQKKMTCPPDTP